MSKKLIWIGSGSASEPAISLANYNEVVLVDARDDALEGSLVKPSDSVRFINKLISINNEPQSFSILNIEEYSSIKTPTGLKELFPNIKVEETIQPTTVSLAQLLSEIEIDGRDNTLVIDTPCLAIQFVDSLAKTSQLPHFSSLYICVGLKPLYEGAGAAEEVKERLRKQFYEGSELSGSDPDVPFLRFTFNQNLAQISMLKDALAKAEAKLQKASESEQRLTGELEQASLTLSEKTEALDAEKQESKKSLDEIVALKSSVQRLQNDNNELQLKAKEATKLNELLTNKDSQLAQLKRNADTYLADNKAKETELEQARKQITSLTLALDVANKKINESEQTASNCVKDFEKKLQIEQQSATEATTKLEELDAKHKEVYSWFASRKKQSEELQLKVEQLKRENETLRAAASTTKALADMEAKMTELFETQRSESVEIANALGQHVTRCSETSREDLLAAQELKKLPAFQSMPLATSPYNMQASNLVQLASLVRNNSYDVIIEFGSGVSTILIADVLCQKVNGEYKARDETLRLDEDNVGESNRALRTTTPLPNYLVTFEQSSRFLKQTTSRLRDQGLMDLVDTCLAPLMATDYKVDGASPALFYDCKEKLLELKRIFTGRKASVLVVVDGPDIEAADSSTRYAALPTVLDYLSAHNITFFLGGSNSNTEKGVIAQWRGEIKHRQLNFNEEVVHTHSGAHLLQVYP